jgi:hypothetical protein
MQQLLACREDGVNVRNPKTITNTINIEEEDVTARIRSPEILGVAKSLHEVVHSDLDGLGGSGITVVENASLSTQLVPKAHHMSIGKGVGQQVDGVVPSHVPNYVLVGKDMGQNPKKLGKDIQVGVACKGNDSVDGSNCQHPPLKVRSKCPT